LNSRGGISNTGATAVKKAFAAIEWSVVTLLPWRSHTLNFVCLFCFHPLGSDWIVWGMGLVQGLLAVTELQTSFGPMSLQWLQGIDALLG
jgi:hypothetical protein